MEKDENPLEVFSSLFSYQCIALVIMGQKRFLESLGDVFVASIVLEVTDAELVQ